MVWLSLRTSDDVDYSDPQEQSSINTFREYNEQLFAAAEASDGYLQVADWATYSNGASGWFEADGVHLTPRGVDAVTTFIAGTVERVLAGENVSPAAAPWTVLVPGAEGETVDGGAGGAHRRRRRRPRRRRRRVRERHDGRRRRVPAAQRRPPGDRCRRHGDCPGARRVRGPWRSRRGDHDDGRRADDDRAAASRRRRSPPRSGRPPTADAAVLPRWPLVAAARAVAARRASSWAAGATSSPSAPRGAGRGSTRRRRRAGASPTCDGPASSRRRTSPVSGIYDHEMERIPNLD